MEYLFSNFFLWEYTVGINESYFLNIDFVPCNFIVFIKSKSFLVDSVGSFNRRIMPSVMEIVKFFPAYCDPSYVSLFSNCCR